MIETQNLMTDDEELALRKENKTMPKIQRMRAVDLKELRDLLAALKAIPGYAPHDPAATVSALEARLTEWETLNTTEVQKENEAAAARDATANVEVTLRKMKTSIRTQVAAQYGRDSDEVAAVGLKKTSEYKPRTRKPKGEATS